MLDVLLALAAAAAVASGFYAHRALSTASFLLLLAASASVGDRVLLGVLPVVGRVEVAVTGDKVPFLLATALVALLLNLYARGYLEHRGVPPWYYGVNAIYVLGMWLVIAFENLFLVFLALELTIVAPFVLMYFFGYGDRRRIAIMFFIWSQIGSISFLIGVALSGHPLAAGFSAAGLAALLVAFGLFVKMGTFMVHFWLPYFHAEAPTPLSALLSPVHVGLMGYWLWRLLPGTDLPLGAVAVYGFVTAVYGSLMVLRERDLKRALAYSTVANMGLLVAAAALGSYEALAWLFVAHAFAKAALFALAGLYIVSQGSRDVEAVVGPSTFLAVAAMGFAVLSGVVGLSLLGKAALAAAAARAVSLAALAWAALVFTAVYSFVLMHKLLRPGHAEAPVDMVATSLVLAAAGVALVLWPILS